MIWILDLTNHFLEHFGYWQGTKIQQIWNSSEKILWAKFCGYYNETKKMYIELPKKFLIRSNRPFVKIWIIYTDLQFTFKFLQSAIFTYLYLLLVNVRTKCPRTDVSFELLLYVQIHRIHIHEKHPYIFPEKK